MSTLRYRGVSYDNATHEQPSAVPVDHAYHGHHYASALRHDAADVDTAVELHDRGHVYHHRIAEAARAVEQG